MAFKSPEAEIVAFLLRSKLVPQQIVARLESPGKEGSSLGNAAHVLVLEVGDSFAERGFGRLNGWLKHH